MENKISQINRIIAKHTAGEATAEETNTDLRELGSDLRINPGKNDLTEYEIEETVVAYELRQSIRVETRDVDRVAAAERDITSLMSDGLAIESFSPRYLYTRLGELKIELTAEAARDARIRAEQIARQSKERLGRLSRGRMGVFQVNAANETETSAEGVNDTESLEKDALAVVGSVFYAE